MTMLDKADIKQEDMTDIIQLLRKCEIKINDLFEFREQEISNGTQEKVEEIYKIEAEEGTRRKEERLQKKKEADLARDHAKRLKMEEKTRKRSETLKVAGKRDNARSEKPQINNKKEEKPVIDQDEVDMNMYLGIAIPKESLGSVV
jgi:hypothetical protein